MGFQTLNFSHVYFAEGDNVREPLFLLLEGTYQPP